MAPSPIIASLHHRLARCGSASVSLVNSRLSRPSMINHQQQRFLDLQEYQSKQLLQENGLKVQKFKVASNPKEVSQILFPKKEGQLAQTRWSGFTDDLSNVPQFVIKAQVLAGGRGKGHFLESGLVGGVKLTEHSSEAEELATKMLGDRLVTKQTLDTGVKVDKVMIAEAVTIVREYYLAILLDRSYDKGPIIVASPMGGMDIEEVAAKDDEAIRRLTIPIDLDLDFETAQKMAVSAFSLNLNETIIIDQIADQMMKLLKLFKKLDASQIEINPLGVTPENEVICIDAKLKFDENARFRHKWLDEVEESNKSETDPREYSARRHNLNFIGLDGSIGCLVNGAGLAMATMDIIKLHGGEPANFLDVGGGATVDQVTAAFEIIKADKNVRAIFVNIFGGIMRCDTVAQGIIEASKRLDLKLPIVVRLEGTRVAEAKKMIEASKLNLISCDDFDAAAEKVVRMAR